MDFYIDYGFHFFQSVIKVSLIIRTDIRHLMKPNLTLMMTSAQVVESPAVNVTTDMQPFSGLTLSRTIILSRPMI